MFFLKQNLQAKQTDRFAQCQEQKYTSINVKTIYLIILYCDLETIQLFH
jgi:hypothetical protein